MIHLHSENDTKLAAAQFYETLLPGQIIALHGPLGAGKTTFTRYLIQLILQNPDLNIPSPTYTLLEIYDCPKFNDIWHFDAYRLEQPADILNTGFDDGLDQKATMLIEWANKIAPYLPAQTRHLYFTLEPDGARKITGW